jgi:hypothetical protein
MHDEVMTTVVTIRDVPDDVRDALAGQARERGQSLQAYLMELLRRQAAFGRNRQTLAEIEAELEGGGGAGPDAPDAADIVWQERNARGTAPEGHVDSPRATA